MLTFSSPSLQQPTIAMAADRSTPYRDDADQDKHMTVIERLALELDRPIHDVRPLYEDILAGLRHHAYIQDYLPILVSKRVKQLLKH